MIGRVFSERCTIPNRRREYDRFRNQVEAITVRGGQLIIAYVSTVLVLSLLQEPFVSREVTLFALVVLAASVLLITHSENGALRSSKATLRPDGTRCPHVVSRPELGSVCRRVPSPTDSLTQYGQEGPFSITSSFRISALRG